VCIIQSDKSTAAQAAAAAAASASTCRPDTSADAACRHSGTAAATACAGC